MYFALRHTPSGKLCDMEVYEHMLTYPTEQAAQKTIDKMGPLLSPNYEVVPLLNLETGRAKALAELADDFDGLCEMLVGFTVTYPVTAVYDMWLDLYRERLHEKYGDEGLGQLEGLVAFMATPNAASEDFLLRAYEHILKGATYWQASPEYAELQRTKAVRERCRDLRIAYVTGENSIDLCGKSQIEFGGSRADWRTVCTLTSNAYRMEVARLATAYTRSK